MSQKKSSWESRALMIGFAHSVVCGWSRANSRTTSKYWCLGRKISPVWRDIIAHEAFVRVMHDYPCLKYWFVQCLWPESCKNLEYIRDTQILGLRGKNKYSWCITHVWHHQHSIYWRFCYFPSQLGAVFNDLLWSPGQLWRHPTGCRPPGVFEGSC